MQAEEEWSLQTKRCVGLGAEDAGEEPGSQSPEEPNWHHHKATANNCCADATAAGPGRCCQAGWTPPWCAGTSAACGRSSPGIWAQKRPPLGVSRLSSLYLL